MLAPRVFLAKQYFSLSRPDGDFFFCFHRKISSGIQRFSPIVSDRRIACIVMIFLRVSVYNNSNDLAREVALRGVYPIHRLYVTITIEWIIIPITVPVGRVVGVFQKRGKKIIYGMFPTFTFFPPHPPYPPLGPLRPPWALDRSARRANRKNRPINRIFKLRKINAMNC